MQEHEGAIDARIAGLINDFNLFKQVKDLSQQLKPIASTLDKLQNDKSSPENYTVLSAFLFTFEILIPPCLSYSVLSV